jgi:hypothetical protein
MNKKKSTPILVIIVLLVSLVGIIFLFYNLIFCSTCFPSSNQTEMQTTQVPIGMGLVPVSKPDQSPAYRSFEEGISKLDEIPGLERDHDNHFQIYFIQGQDLDENGWAGKWLFEVKSTGGTELRILDRHGWTSIPWNVTHSVESIKTDTIVSPSVLFNQSRSLILQNSPASSAPVREIELQGNVYTLTITSANASKIMKFDATTGALIE